jgi:hypothetical protein
MARGDPVEFVRALADDNRQRCGNRVRIEDENALIISAANPLPVTEVNTITDPLFTTDTWRVELIADEGANDNDKTVITVPGDEEIQVLWVWVELTTDATVGDRQLVVEVQDTANDVIAQFRVGVVQAASLTCYYILAPALADLTAFRDTDYLMTPLPPTLILRDGDQLRIYDNNNVSGTDDMVVQVQYAEREI